MTDNVARKRHRSEGCRILASKFSLKRVRSIGSSKSVCSLNERPVRLTRLWSMYSDRTKIIIGRDLCNQAHSLFLGLFENSKFVVFSIMLDSLEKQIQPLGIMIYSQRNRHFPQELVLLFLGSRLELSNIYYSHFESTNGTFAELRWKHDDWIVPMWCVSTTTISEHRLF